MGDLANMMDNDGRVNGHRLLRWLRRRAEMERARMEALAGVGADVGGMAHFARAALLTEMADDLEGKENEPEVNRG